MASGAGIETLHGMALLGRSVAFGKTIAGRQADQTEDQMRFGSSSYYSRELGVMARMVATNLYIHVLRPNVILGVVTVNS